MALTVWSKDKIQELIELLRDAPALWDIKSKEFHDREKKSQEMQNMAARLSVSEEELAKKIKSIKTQYRREYTKQLQHERNDLSSSREKEWFGYRPLSFLRKNITSKEMYNPAQDDSGEDDNEDKDDADSSSSSSSDEENPVACPTPKTQVKIRVKKETPQSSESNNQTLKRKLHDELFNDTSKCSSPATVQEKRNHPKKGSAIYGENVAGRMGPSMQGNHERTNGELLNTSKYSSPPTVQEIRNPLTDDLAIYGQNVARRMEHSMQGFREIAIARHEIDKILFKLEMGGFR